MSILISPTLSEELLADTPNDHWGEEIRIYLKIAMPTIVTCIVQYIPNMLSVAFVGQFCSKEDLDGASLGSMYSNVLGLSLGLGFATALDSLSAHAHGAGNTMMLGVYVQRGLLILFLMFIPVCFANYFTKDILVLAGQPEDVAELAGQYARWAIPSILCIWVYEVFRKTLQVLGIVNPMFWIALVQNSLSIGLCYFFLKFTDIGFVGAAIARSIAAGTLPFMMIGYLVYSKNYKLFWGGVSFEAARRGWREFFKYGLPGMFSVCLEWWAFEFMSILSGLTRDAKTNIGTNSILIQVTSMTYMVYFGSLIAINVRVGAHLGANNFKSAQAAFKVGFMFNILASLTLGVTMYLGRGLIAKFFTQDEGLQEEIKSTLWLVSIYQIPDSINTACGGAFRGAGMQATAATVMFIAYYLVGLPLGSALAFIPDSVSDQLTLLWVGITSGLFCSGMLSLLLVFRIPWVDVALKISSQQAAQRAEENGESSETPLIQSSEA